MESNIGTLTTPVETYEHEAARLINEATHPRMLGIVADDEVTYERTMTCEHNGRVITQTVRASVVTTITAKEPS